MFVREFCGQDRFPDSPRRFGLELEVEGVRGQPTDVGRANRNGWAVINDGSLRDGLEFISNPMEIRELQAAVELLYEQVRQYDYTSSIRTSTHIHANMQDQDVNAVCALVCAHVLLEPLLFRFCGPQREGNIYCVPWYRGEQLSLVKRALVDESFHAFMESCKYSSLFLGPLGNFGTIEFRHAPFWRDEDSLQQWIDMVSSLVFNSLTLFRRPADVLEMYDAVGANRFVEEVLGIEGAENLRQSGVVNFEEVIEEYDTPILLSDMLDSLCTYKVRDWIPPAQPTGDVGLTRGYRTTVHRPMMYNSPSYLEMIGEMDEGPEYDDEYDEEYID